MRKEVYLSAYLILQDELFNQTPNLTVECGSVDDLVIDGDSGQCQGILLRSGERVGAAAVVLTTGTFLRGQINFGTESYPAGRMAGKDGTSGEAAAVALGQTLERLQFRLGRMKTGERVLRLYFCAF